MGFRVNISVELGFPLNCVGLSPLGLAGFTWGGYKLYGGLGQNISGGLCVAFCGFM
jgi:hypothetical protein